MWPVMRGLWKARRGRKAAVAVIAPLVERSRHRLDGIPGRAWLDPYMVGFMMMLITLTARRSVSIADSQTLGIVQSEAWADITGMALSLIGEETVQLSAAQHKLFEQGCRNAVAFDLALHGTSVAGVEDVTAGRIDAMVDACVIDPQQLTRESEDIAALWQHYFEGHVRG